MILNMSNFNKFVFHLLKTDTIMYMYSFCFCKILCSSISFNNFWILGWATLFYCCTP